MKNGSQVNEITFARTQQSSGSPSHRPKAIREVTVPDLPVVSIQGFQYLVDLGTRSEPRYHRVNKSKECNCGDLFCEAIEAVRQYLQAGGLRAPDPVGEFLCPICGSKTYRDRKWDGRFTKEPGWRCEKGGLTHFLEAKSRQIKKQLQDNPWLIPPAPGYPGVRRDALLTVEECEAISRKVYLETGYDPTA
jgi:hypothetical protein